MFNAASPTCKSYSSSYVRRAFRRDDKVEEYEFGRFGWIMDPEGNRVELWEPPQGS